MNPIKKNLTFPNGLYEYLVRKANAAVNKSFIEITFPIIEFKFLESDRKGSPQTIDYLFGELSKRIGGISKKYNLDFQHSMHRKKVMVEYNPGKTERIIQLSGYHFIPLKSFGNILYIAVWSYIVYSLGKKPKEDEYAKKLETRYNDSLNEFKDYWNRMPRKKIPLTDERLCFVCGKSAFVYNQWIYKYKGQTEEVLTPVCEKHRDVLI